MTNNSGSPIPVWFVGGVAALLALGLSIFVGLRIVDMFDDSGSESFPPFPSLPFESSPAGPTELPSIVAQTPPPLTPPAPTPAPTPTATPTPTPTPALSIMKITGGSIEGDHPVHEAHALIEDGYIKVRLVFQVPDGPCTLELVLFIDSVSGTYLVEEQQAKGSVLCAGGGNGYGLYSGPINLIRQETLSGDFNLSASGQEEIIQLIGEFEDLAIEGG